jgi:D-alanyl-lipoteichoic acid acyltransferase DltB (MBOAT superfamily)
LLAASYVFYGWWDWRFLGLIFLSSLVDFLVGNALAATTRTGYRRTLLGVSLSVNLGMLGVFKYFNFFAESLQTVLQSVNIHVDPMTLKVVLPVGISFYTFQTLSYTIDIFRRKTEPTRDLIAFFAFVSFFPQLVAGPIERASTFLPQFLSPRRFILENAKDGVRQMTSGLLKKVVIADNLAPHVNQIFGTYSQQDSLTLVLGTLFFALQIYCDFSGYSDIAIGTARLFGFSLRRNFAYPYFAQDIAEFWRRWHISLSTWFRDYVFIPLGGSRTATLRVAFNILVTFAVSGLWHGANWTFVIWGVLHALYYLPRLFIPKLGKDTGRDATSSTLLPNWNELVFMVTNFFIVCVAWVFFRAPSVEVAVEYLRRIVSSPFLGTSGIDLVVPTIACASVLIVEWLQRNRQHPLEIASLAPWARRAIYLACAITFLVFGNFGSHEFIYFQF